MKPIFSNLIVYEMGFVLPENFKTLVEDNAFDALSRDQYSGQGFIEICPGHRVIESDGRLLVRFVEQERRINRAARDSLADERIKKIEGEGRELKGSEKWAIIEQAERELLPYSDTKTSSCYILFCPFEKMVYVSCSSQNATENVFTFIRRMLGKFPVKPLEFNLNLSLLFSQYITSGKKIEPPLPRDLTIDDYGALVCSGDDGQKISMKNICFSDESLEEVIRADHLIVNQIDVALRADKTGETLATFKLSITSSGDIALKKFDYEMSATFELDVSVANEEGEGDQLHQYTTEMLVVSRYMKRIIDSLAVFASGIRGKDGDSDATKIEEAPVEASAGADEQEGS